MSSFSAQVDQRGATTPSVAQHGNPSTPTPRVTRGPLAITLVILFLCCILSPITLAVADSGMEITEFPRYWDVASSFRGYAHLSNPVTMWELITVTVQLSYESFFDLSICNISAGEDLHTTSSNVDEKGRAIFVIENTTGGPSEVYKIVWNCNSASIKLYNNPPRPPAAASAIAVYLEAKISVGVDSVFSRSDQVPVGYVLPQSLSITHHLRWAHPQHDWDPSLAEIAGMVAVDYFIFRTAGQGPTEYRIQHPWLVYDLERKPMHIPRDDIEPSDLQRFYQHLPYFNGLQLKCAEINLWPEDRELRDSWIEIQTDTLGRPKISINPQVQLTSDYLCRFTLYYPPDVIYYSLHKSTTPIGLHDGNMLYQTPNAGIQGIPYPRLEEDFQSFIWVSPHHRRYYNDFEFSIAIPKYYYTGFQNPFVVEWDHESEPLLTIEVDVIGQAVLDDPIRDDVISIKCYTHIDNRDDDETTPIGESFNTSRETISVSSLHFSDTGLTCRVRTTSDHDGHIPRVVRFLMNGQQHAITVFNSFHQNVVDDTSTPRMTLTLYDPAPPSSGPNPSPLQAMGGVAIPFSTTTIDQHAVGSFHLQYTPVMPSSSHFQEWFLHLLFPDETTIAVIADRSSEVGNIRVTLSNGHVLVDEEVSIEMSQMDVDYSMLVEKPEDIEDVFVPGRGIRIPTIVFPLHAFLDSTQPLLITVRFRTNGYLSEESINVYPMLLPSHFSSMRVYEPQFALITRVLDTPLTGYSYRCVAWDKMAGNYIYNPATGGTPSVETFTPCPSPFDPATGDVVNVHNNPHWRRVQYPRWTALQWEMKLMICLYELAAVCVTPSATHAEDGTYDVRPLADCPSFLGAVHAVPCNLVENSEESQWDYTIQYYKGSYDGENSKLRLALLYNGDPRATATITAAVHPIDEFPPHNERRIMLTNTFLPFATMNPQFQVSDRPSLGETILDLPWFLGGTNDSSRLFFQIELNGFGGSRVRSSIPYYRFEELEEICLLESQDADADDDEPPRPTGNIIDQVTHLCVCGPGTVPESIDHQGNIFLHPAEVKCVSVCGNGTTWDAGEDRCDCLKSEYSDRYCTKPVPKVKPAAQACHTIPPNVVPPFYTTACGYGMYTNSQCNQCECFTPWGFDASGQCLDCIDLKSTCIPGRTSQKTFYPQYCRVGRCLCEPGFYGVHCEQRVMYGTIHYSTTPTADQLVSLAGTVAGGSPFVIPRSRIPEFQTRLAKNVQTSLGTSNVEVFVQQGTQVLSDDKEKVKTTIVYGLRRLDLTNTQSISDNDPNYDNMWFSVPLQNQSGGGAEFSDMYYAWEQMQANYKDRPVANDEQFGQADSIASAYDPHCVPNAYTHCPDGEDNLLPPESQVDEDELEEIPTVITNETTTSSDKTTTYIIIGVVLGVVVIAFVGLVIAILYCKKHEKACFNANRKKSKGARKSKSGQDNVELASQTASTASPSGTMSTSNYLPTQVQVDDPTLPADWIALEDKSTGKIYYSNKITMESSWHHPAQPKEEADNDYGW